MGSNFLTSIQVGCLAAPEWVLTNNKNILIQKIFCFKTSSYSTTPAMASRIRQNYKEESEALINKQINMEFYASYVYMSMYTYFDRDDVAYKGLAAFFKKSSDEEREHGEKLIQDIAKPSSMEWGSPVDALEAALELEKTVNQSLLDMHKASDGDAHLCDFIEGEFLGEQVDAIKEISG